VALSVGMGLTNDCNLHCAHCYRPTDGVHTLTLGDVARVCEHLPVGSIGLGTGENALHPQFLEIVTYLHARGIKLSIASNGYSLNTMPEEYLRCFHDVELSIDFPSEDEQDAFRGQGNWRDVHRAMERSVKAGVYVSILATMMNTNYDRMDQLAALARSLAVNLRVNVYQPVQNARFTLGYGEFWEGFRRLLGVSRLVSCTEPVVSAVLGGGVAPTCAHESVRITPLRRVTPCVYWPDSSLGLEDLSRLGVGILDTPVFRSARQVPPSAAQCPCQGGCAGRRALLGALDQHDIYCPWNRGDAIHLDHTLAPATDLVRKRNYCTTIVM
jgi:MoaA/NifB/PqqE/SkfB family radical SAM enzyme